MGDARSLMRMRMRRCMMVMLHKTTFVCAIHAAATDATAAAIAVSITAVAACRYNGAFGVERNLQLNVMRFSISFVLVNKRRLIFLLVKKFIKIIV